MKGSAWFLLLFYFVITIFWIRNSQYLFSTWGVVVWLVSIGLGFLAYKKIKDKSILKMLLLFGSFFMVLLLLVTGLIHIAVSSMP